jgi:hypothetical protein
LRATLIWNLHNRFREANRLRQQYPPGAEFQMVSDLKRLAETISQNIEREVRKILPPMVTLQANFQFDKGSILITGAVAIGLLPSYLMQQRRNSDNS